MWEGANASKRDSIPEMGKNPKFWVRAQFGFFDDKGSVLSTSKN